MGENELVYYFNRIKQLEADIVSLDNQNLELVKYSESVECELERLKSYSNSVERDLDTALNAIRVLGKAANAVIPDDETDEVEFYSYRVQRLIEALTNEEKRHKQIGADLRAELQQVRKERDAAEKEITRMLSDRHLTLAVEQHRIELIQRLTTALSLLQSWQDWFTAANDKEHPPLRATVAALEQRT